MKLLAFLTAIFVRHFGCWLYGHIPSVMCDPVACIRCGTTLGGAL